MTPRAYQLATMNQTPSHNNRIFFPGEEEEDEDEEDRETEPDRASTPPQRSSSDNDNASLNTTNILEPAISLPPRPPRPQAPTVPLLDLKLDTEVETVSLPDTKPPVLPVVEKEKEKERSPPKRLLIPTDSEVNMVERAALSQAATVHTSATVAPPAPTRVSPSNAASSAVPQSTTSEPPSPPTMTYVATPQPPPAQTPTLPLRSPVHAYIHRVPGSATNKSRVNNGTGKPSPLLQVRRNFREDEEETKEAPPRSLLHGELVNDNDSDEAILAAYANQNKPQDQVLQDDVNANPFRVITCAVDETCVIS